MPNRMIREGLMESEAVLSLPAEGRWLFVTILLSADDVGLFEATPFKLARRADVRREMAEKLLQMLVDADLVRLYQVDGKAFGFIPRFGQRLQIKRAKHPAPPAALLVDDADALNKIKHLAVNPTVTHGDPRLSTVVQQCEPEPEPEFITNSREGGAAVASQPTAKLSPPRTKREDKTLKAYLAECKELRIKPVPPNHAIRDYCRDAGISDDMLAVAWCVFRDDYLTGTNKAKRYKDWPGHFANAVRGCWAKLWYTGDAGVAWTSRGQQEKAVLDARAKNKEGATA